MRPTITGLPLGGLFQLVSNRQIYATRKRPKQNCQTIKGGGTPAYQSPEQRQGEAPAVADDVYAFAALLYELITGCLPFGVNPSLAHLEPLALPLGPSDSSPAFSELTELVHATLGSDPSRRPKSMYVFLDALESVMAFWR